MRGRGALGFDRARGEGERQEEIKKRKQKFYLPLLHVQEKKKKEQCRSKRHCFVFSSFFKKMNRRCFGQNASFHLNKNSTKTCELPNQSSIRPLFI
jgi:tRNA A22 N-methylase